MPINNNLESLRLRALSHFSPNATFLQRTLARIPVFFIGLTAFFNEALLGLKSILFKAIPLNKGDAKSQETIKTEKVSLQIFKLLWKTPSKEEINKAKLGHLTANLSGIRKGAHTELTLDMASFVGIESFNPVSTKNQLANALKAFKEMPQNQTLFDFLKNRKEQEVDYCLNYLRSFNFNSNELTPKSLTSSEFSKIKAFLDNNFQSPMFNLELIFCLKDESLKDLFYKLIQDEMGSIPKVIEDIENTMHALTAYEAYLTKHKLKEGISIKLLQAFQKETKADQKTLSILQNILKTEIFSPLLQDCPRKQIALKLPGIDHPGWAIAKHYQHSDCLIKEEDPSNNLPKLYTLQFFDLIYKKLNEQFPQQQEANFNKTLAIILASTQALDAEILKESLFPQIALSIKSVAAKEGLSSRIEPGQKMDTFLIDKKLPDDRTETYQLLFGKPNVNPIPESCEISFEDGNFILKGFLTRSVDYMHDRLSRDQDQLDSVYESSDSRIQVPFNLTTLCRISDGNLYYVARSQGVKFDQISIE